jgi:hypothetical protein
MLVKDLPKNWAKILLVLNFYAILFSRRLMRMWRNWYTRTLEVRVALPCEFESRHPHFKIPVYQWEVGNYCQ